MRKIGVILFSLAVSLTLVLLGGTAYAEGSSDILSFAVTEDRGEYVLSDYTDGTFGAELARAESIGELLSAIDSEDTSVFFDSVRADENISLTRGNITLSGELSLVGRITVGEGVELSLDSLSLSIKSGTVTVKGGSLTVISGAIYTSDTAVCLTGMAKSHFSLIGGVISAESDSPAVLIEQGTADLYGGRVENSSGVAIENFSTLNLGAGLSLYGRSYEIVTTVPIYLSSNGTSFSSGARVQYRGEFGKGTLTPVFYKSSASAEYLFSLYDINGEKQVLSYFDNHASVSEENFIAVHNPFTVSFKIDGELYREERLLLGDSLSFPEVEEKEGYSLCSWFYDEDMTESASLGTPVDGDLVLYADYILKKPTFSLGNLTFTYDTELHYLEFSRLEHPLSDSGFYTYQWQDEMGNIISSSKSLALCSVEDTGSYKCKVTFTVGRDTAYFETPFVSVAVNKCPVPVPSCDSATYNGKIQYSSLLSTSVYTVQEISGKNAGAYPVMLTLKDSDNYAWIGTDEPCTTVYFEILKANNIFLEELSVKDVYFGSTPSPLAISQFGEVSYLYSTEPNGAFSSQVPCEIGVYYVKAEILGSDNYFALESAPKMFRIKSEEILSVSVNTLPTDSEYYAFDLFNPEGLSLKVVYTGGRERIISASELSFFYQSDVCLRYGDTAVTVEYLGHRINLPVTVLRKEYTYDLSFLDKEVEYNGLYQSIEYELSSVTGLDGFPLTVKAIGGGVNVGEYTVTISFSSRSKDYLIPADITRTLYIKPRAVEVIFGERNFVYNGYIQVPTAHYYDVFGAKIPLTVVGGRSEAGDNCYATALPNDNNYTLLNSRTTFFIAKADFDFSAVSLNKESIVYNSLEQTVVLTGLPSGISVLGYVGNSAINVGRYKTEVLFDYDTNNYNVPPLSSFEWEITPASYDTSLFKFLNTEVIYDGSLHYPSLLGEMPIGLDGSHLSYFFSEGQRDKGERVVKITFYTDSENYVVPEEQYATVKILAKGILVLWGENEFVYNGYLQLPDALSDECPIAIHALGVNAGDHVATAVSLSDNFYVINSEMKYTIKKRSNAFIVSPSVSDIFCGRVPTPFAEAENGEVAYKYYLDKELTLEADGFDKSGVYYLVCEVPESENYLSLLSPPIPFRVIEVVPISVEVSLCQRDYYAFELLIGEDFICKVTNNDGSHFFFDNPEIIYENNSCLTATDSTVSFRCFGFVTKVDIEVKKINYDMSGVLWRDTEHVYDGVKKEATLTGLPDGVSVLEYTYGTVINAGEYPLSAILSYDSNNYNAPLLPEAFLHIAKATVVPSTVYTEEYDASPRLPVSDNPLYVFDTEQTYVNAGVYEIPVRLVDCDNYILLSDKCSFVIPKRKITVRVSNLTLYLFEDVENITGEITEGSIIDTDTDVIAYFSNGDMLGAKSVNPNYELTVIEGKIERLNRLNDDSFTLIFIIAVLLLLLGFALSVFLLRRRRVFLEPVVCSGLLPEPASPKEEHSDTDAKDSTVTLERAENMITDAIAKTLIRKRDISISTGGRKRGIINIDTLSLNFSAEERIDINTLKQKGLISKEISYIKVLGRGSVDKPLKVYANSFSLSAVKMLALSGGEANRVRTNRI